MIKRKINALVSAAAASAFLFSCASAPQGTISDRKQIEDEMQIEIEDEFEIATEEKSTKEPHSIKVQDTSNQLETQFKEYLNEIDIKIISKPKKAVYSKTDFKEPYVIQVTDSNGPAVDVDITVSWPTSRNDDIITYSTAQLKTDSRGQIFFKPEASRIAVKDTISFYPTPVSSSSSIVQASYAAGVQSEYAVKSSYTTYPGGILFVYDFNENGKPTQNNFSLLQNLRNHGINAGNAPISDVAYLSKPVSTIYNDCKAMVGNAAKFLVFGSFKYATPTEETASGVKCTLVAELTCVDMANGEKLYKTSIVESAIDKSKWTAEQKCREALAKKAMDAIIYGM